MKPVRGYAAIALHNPKFAVNVGGAVRAASIYNAALIVISGSRYTKAGTDTTRGHRHIPVISVQDAEALHAIVPYDCVPVAVNLLKDATPLPEYKHPERALYIFGQEDGTLGKAVTAWCRDKIAVPTAQCMNLAATVNVVLYDRLSKEWGKHAGRDIRKDLSKSL